ncbi:peptide deformylase [Frigoribacterium sp. ACAM 257]|uniref:peptide deformylase n=1 Tax=Frigoribacterium sp. ACAM 257 TaxID=2508998 RepID=UPI0011B9EEA7|nr:peptide deformylase [Frigoribacterium sp. ACAM 257]TWX40871.1 peptide deformylase [Frigoribacterium sp. ACAM 257]
MSVRPIRLFGDPVLRSPSDRVRVGDARLASLVDDLLDTVREPGRAGVAAPQIGVGLRAFSYNVDGDVGYVLNPEITDVSGEKELVEEGCLSVPGFWFPTPRWSHARVEGIDLAGDPVVLEGDGLMAQALQHETDHLAGTLYVMTLETETRRDALRQIRASDWWRA